MNHLIEQLRTKTSGKSILIVEDDFALAESLERLLSHFFTTTSRASSLKDALKNHKELSKNAGALIVITDIHLGKENGLDLIKQLKQLNTNQKIIAISGTEDREIFAESIRYGVDRFVLKPINQYELFGALISVAERIDYDEELEKNRHLLEESKEYALKLLEEQDRFLKNAIHEIHTPLAVIITNIDLMRLEGIDNPSLDAIEAGSRIIQNSYEDMTYLMKRDRVADPEVTIDLIEFIRERVRYFNCIAEVNELSISIRISHPYPLLFTFSELKLARLIDNTLSNAIKYSYRPGEIDVIAGLRKDALFFEVRNRGPIIQDKKKIFQRFYRESEHKGGYGLGLSIVAQICKEEDIDIQISSTAIRGTAFRYIFKNASHLQHNFLTMTVTKNGGEST